MRFRVPQFIEKESKLVGPLTLRQFLWVVAGGTLFAITQFFLSGMALFIATAIIAVVIGCMAYLKVNEVPLPKYVQQAFVFLLMNKKLTFQKNEDQTSETK